MTETLEGLRGQNESVHRAQMASTGLEQFQTELDPKRRETVEKAKSKAEFINRIINEPGTRSFLEYNRGPNIQIRILDGTRFRNHIFLFVGLNGFWLKEERPDSMFILSNVQPFRTSLNEEELLKLWDDRSDPRKRKLVERLSKIKPQTIVDIFQNAISGKIPSSRHSTG